MLKRRIKSVIIFSLTALISTSFFIQSYGSDGGIAISGSFNGSVIKMVPGETFETDGVYIVLFNNYDINIFVDVNVRVTNEDNDLVDSLIFLFELGELEIAADSNVKVPISFEVPDDMLPGEYVISIGATLIQAYTPGIVAVPVVRQKASLEIFGEAGTFVANFFDEFGQPFTGQIDVYREEGDRIAPVISTFDQTVSDRLVPGTYVIRVVHEYDENGFIVLEETMVLNDGDDLELNYTVQTVFADSFVIAPLVGDDDVLLNAILNYRLRNIYQEVDDVVISLEVLYKGVEVEKLVIQELTLLGLGLTSLRTNYVPPEGWRNGVYTFTISVFALDESNDLIELLVTDGYNINVTSIPTDSLPLWLVLVGASVIVSLGVVIVVVVLKGKEKETDIVCLDDDPSYLEALSKLIDGGDKK
jgi:hypothetical protein